MKSVRIRSYSGPYSVRMQENTDQNNSEYGQSLRNEDITMKKFDHIISFICPKATVRSNTIIDYPPRGQFLVLEDWGDNSYHRETQEKTDEVLQSVYVEAVSLTDKFGIEKKCTQQQQMNWNKIHSETTKEYW